MEHEPYSKVKVPDGPKPSSDLGESASPALEQGGQGGSGFNEEVFARHFVQFARGELAYSDLERIAGGLPVDRGYLRRILDALESGMTITRSLAP
jgi:hypothetical protein